MHKQTPAAFLGLLLLCTLPLPAEPLGIEPGFLVMRTTSAQVNMTLHGDFFDPGSDPVILMQVPLQGKELSTQPSHLLDPGDTVFELLPVEHEPTNTFGLRVVALHLEGRKPVTVTYQGGADPELWNVEVCLPKAKQPGGIVQLAPPVIPDWCGSTFKYSLTVQPRLLFTRQRDHAQRVLEPGEEGSLGLVAGGHWLDRGRTYANEVSFVETGGDPGGAIDINCDDVFDQDEEGIEASSNLILGAQCSKVVSVYPEWAWSLEPYPEDGGASAFVEPATRASSSFPASAVDRPAVAEPGLARPGRKGAAGLAGLALLGLAAVLIPARRDEDG